MLSPRLRLSLLFAAVAMIVAYLALVVAYLFNPIFFDHVEAQFPCITWYFIHGRPLYNNLDDPEWYILPYGPVPYLIQGVLLSVIGPSIFSAKLGGAIAATLAVWVAYLVSRQSAPRAVALMVVGLLVAYWVGVSYTTICSRADVWMLLFSLIGLWACARPGWQGAVILGLCLGICLDVKLHGPLYFLPMIGVALRHAMGWRKLFVAGILAVLVFLLPFVLLPNVSLGNFFAELVLTARQGLALHPFLIDCAWIAAVFALLPVALALSWFNNPLVTRRILRANWLTLAGLGLALLPVTAIASKYGAGAPHLVPLTTIAILVGLQLWREGLDFSKPASLPAVGAVLWLAASVICCFGYGFYKVGEGFWSMRTGQTQAAYAAKADAENILSREGPSHVLLMGVGDKISDFDATFMQCQLVFGGMPIGLAHISAVDRKDAHMAPPSLGRLRESLAQRYPGKSIIWLIPKGKTPFTYAFPDAVRAEFNLDYVRFDSTPCFDLYIERAAQP